MARSTGKSDSLISVKVTLRDVRPRIWRRLSMPGRMSLGDLHQAIQAAMGWDGYHLHLFEIGGRHCGDPELVDDVDDEERVALSSLVKSGVSRFSYTYDFGDDWEHSILIEKRPPPAGAPTYPACTAGERSCPPEDCGGPGGYENLLAVLADPSHPGHGEQTGRLGEDFDPEDFSVAAADARVAASFTRS